MQIVPRGESSPCSRMLGLCYMARGARHRAEAFAGAQDRCQCVTRSQRRVRGVREEKRKAREASSLRGDGLHDP